MINIGVLSAVSVSQQQGKAGVMTEVLGCSGLNFTAQQAGRILRWQLMMGVTSPVVHCAYNSTEGLRLTEAPPDFGPDSSRWPGMVDLGHELARFQDYLRGAIQIAPVAVVWPILSALLLIATHAPSAQRYVPRGTVYGIPDPSLGWR